MTGPIPLDVLFSPPRIKHGEKITEPGVYDVPMLWYHADCCAGPSLSSSGVRKIVQRSPAHYWDTSPLNKDRVEDDEAEAESAALRIGRAAHTLLLEPDKFQRLYVARPTTWDSWRTKEAKAWRADHQREGYTVLDPAEMDKVRGIRGALAAHPIYQAGILEGALERSMFWKDPRTGVWLKSRPDAIPVSANLFADLKSVSDASDEPLRRKIFDFGWDIQMALAGVGMHNLLGREMDEYVIVAVEQKRPHGIAHRPIDKEEIWRGLQLLRAGVNRFAKCIEENRWPSYEDDDGIPILRPKYAADRHDRLVEHGMLPKEF